MKINDIEDCRERTKIKISKGVKPLSIKQWIRRQCPYHGISVINNFYKSCEKELKTQESLKKYAK